MTDFEYDAIKQKQIANGARHRKCGSKSKRCSLPSDYLSNKEWREKCGRMVAYHMNEPMAWVDFKVLADRSQKEYLEHLRDTYGATAVDLGEMFGVTALTVRRTASRIGVEFRKGQHMSRKKQEAWDNFISGEEPSESCEEMAQSVVELPPVPCPAEPEPTEPAQIEAAGTKMTQFSIRFEGKIDVQMIANSLFHILGDTSDGVVVIQCELA